MSTITVHRWPVDDVHRFPDLSIPLPAGAAPVFHRERPLADALLDSSAAAFPELPRHREAFHALLCPIRFRGETTWFSSANTLLTLADKVPGGAAAVGTSAGTPGHIDRS